MRKKIYTALVIMLVFIVFWVGSIFESTYTRQATIKYTTFDTVVCVDKQGNIWSYKGSGTVGADVTLIMFDNHTGIIEDDVVKGVK